MKDTGGGPGGPPGPLAPGGPLGPGGGGGGGGGGGAPLPATTLVPGPDVYNSGVASSAAFLAAIASFYSYDYTGFLLSSSASLSSGVRLAILRNSYFLYSSAIIFLKGGK